MDEERAEAAAVDRHDPRPSSIPSGDGSVWADVSPLLEAACTDLPDGELIHGDNFNLFAAMSALEIMDPKMDSGMVSRYYSVDEAIENGAAPVPISCDKTGDVQCTIDIMDHLLACEATWHKGHSLAQTVFSCIYLLRPERTSSHALLHSYSRIIRATCKAVVSVVSDARTHEEEDLFTMAYGLPLIGEDEKCLSMLNAVEETIARQLRACKAPSSGRKVIEDLEPLQNNLALEEGYCKAILCRLRFRKHFYHVLMCLKRPQGRGLQLARKHISSCLSELEIIRKSTEVLRSNDYGTHNCGEDKTTASGRRPVGFDASINTRLSAPTPPRSIKILSWSEAVEYFVKLLHDLDIICSFSLDASLEGILQFMVQFQKSHPDLVSRAHLQTLLIQDGKLYGRDPIFAVIAKAAGLPEIVRNHDIQNGECLVHLGQLVINLLKILSTNAAWQRRKLGKIVQDWRVIHIQLELALRQEMGEESGISADQNGRGDILRQILIWVEEQTFWIASRFLMLGFELELYSPGEYCMVYWYIYVVLIKLAERMHHKMSFTNATAKLKGKKKKGSTKDMSRDFQIPASVLFLQSYICLAEGLTMMLAALKNERMLSQSPSPFNSDHERFIQHFELLQKAGVPDHISYQSFEESTKNARFSTLVMYNYFKDAQRIAKEVKNSFPNDPERQSELRRIEQVAEHNSIALTVLCRLGSLDSSLKVSFDFSHHPYFATAVVKRS
ncbi:N-alpha-acetyltransferase 35, NatC auxiliary subunit isoform X1 [Rhodamnia argentea]|uniref:N-alpha-acetyltransferase 35, NatC auxiliary subunit isoform X1 n=2 Tax=Rhodamnia argentea TaxID=178133 RepID=A0A8B8QNK4_9MYRT|nr:N-alpha-acetyltransferase 35, NatC auxiliary subunit isoform X1 [Rhodamnia argentea]